MCRNIKLKCNDKIDFWEHISITNMHQILQKKWEESDCTLDSPFINLHLQMPFLNHPCKSACQASVSCIVRKTQESLSNYHKFINFDRHDMITLACKKYNVQENARKEGQLEMESLRISYSLSLIYSHH